MTNQLVQWNFPKIAAVKATSIETILATSSNAFRGVFEARFGDDADSLDDRIGRAEALLEACEPHLGELRTAMEPLAPDEIVRQMMGFVASWPNASSGDLAGYGAQLAQDVIDRAPCRYALREALRKLRHGSKFLPSIAEVITTLDQTQSAIRSTAWHIVQIPALVAKAKEMLAVAQGREAALPQVSAAPPLDPSNPRIDLGGGVTAALSTIRAAIGRGQWLDQWGPKPGEPGCRVPKNLLDEGVRS